MTQEQPDLVKYSLRLPKDLYVRLAELAQKHRRSINKELVYMIEQAVAAEQAHKEGADERHEN